jgi:hypothetical protein
VGNGLTATRHLRDGDRSRLEVIAVIGLERAVSDPAKGVAGSGGGLVGVQLHVDARRVGEVDAAALLPLALDGGAGGGGGNEGREEGDGEHGGERLGGWSLMYSLVCWMSDSYIFALD